LQLIGALMSALNLLAEELEKEGLSSFEKKEEPRSIAIKFTNLSPKEFFNNWDNDISIFDDFEKQI